MVELAADVGPIKPKSTPSPIRSSLLIEEHYAVSRAYDGVSALQLLSSEPHAPDVMLCDVMLPRMTGDRVAAEVRRLCPSRHLMPKPLNFPVLMPLLEELTAPRSDVAIATSVR